MYANMGSRRTALGHPSRLAQEWIDVRAADAQLPPEDLVRPRIRVRSFLLNVERVALSRNPVGFRFGRERILDAYRDCRVRAEGHCGWPETRARIEDVFMNYRNEAWYEGSMVVGFKVQYEHIAQELRPDFARWLECNQVDVLHLSRGAVVESFWTLQVSRCKMQRYALP